MCNDLVTNNQGMGDRSRQIMNSALGFPNNALSVTSKFKVQFLTSAFIYKF